MALPCKKVFIDTKHRTPDSVDTPNFKIELPDTLYMPNNTVFTLLILLFHTAGSLLTMDGTGCIYRSVTLLAQPPQNPMNVGSLSSQMAPTQSQVLLQRCSFRQILLSAPATFQLISLCQQTYRKTQ